MIYSETFLDLIFQFRSFLYVSMAENYKEMECWGHIIKYINVEK